MILDLSAHRDIELNVSFSVKKEKGIATSHPDDPISSYEEDIEVEVESIELVMFGVGLDVTPQFWKKFPQIEQIIKENYGE